MGVWLDDEFPEHPKVEALEDDLAAWLYVAGLCYANRNLTGGRIPKAAALRLTNKASRKLIARLLAPLVPGKGPLWEDHGDHYRIHDYDQHQQSAEKRRAEVEEGKRKRSEHARRAALARHHGQNEQGSEQELSTDRASPEHPPGSDPAEGGALPGDAQALARASAGERATRGRPNALVPTHRSSSSLDGVGDAGAEEEDAGQEPEDPVAHVCRLVAERRHDKRSEPIPEGIRRDRWLVEVGAQLRIEAEHDIRAMLASSRSVAEVVDLYEPPGKPPASEPVPSREHVPCPLDEVWDEAAGEWRLVDRTSA